MATSLMRMSIRQALNAKNLLEKKLLPALCANIYYDSVPTVNNKCDSNSCSIVYPTSLPCGTRNMSSSKRNVHHNMTSAAAVDEDEKSDAESDNESDDEDSRKQVSRASSPFWRRKMRTLHSHWDVNKDGVLSFDDFKLWGERFSTLGHLSQEQKDEFQNVLLKMWEQQWGPIDPYNFVDVEKYLQEMNHVLEDKSLRRKVHDFLPYLFKAVDKDNSGEISVQEFKLFFECLGLSNDDAVVTFCHIDTNEDGKISQKEFIKLGREFFLTDDPKRPSKHFWGPLVD